MLKYRKGYCMSSTSGVIGVSNLPSTTRALRRTWWEFYASSTRSFARWPLRGKFVSHLIEFFADAGFRRLHLKSSDGVPQRVKHQQAVMMERKMWFDILLQAVMILAGILMFLWMHDVPRKFLDNLQSWRNKSKYEAKRRFVLGARLLAQAKSSDDLTLARSAEAEVQAAIDLDPSDAAAHILKALALEFQGFKTSALSSVDVALSPLAVKSLSDEERSNALLKRAELRLEVSRLARLRDDSEDLNSAAIEEDLREAVRLQPENAKAWCLLGDCREAKGMREEARAAFEEAIKADPDCKTATQGLDRLRL
ncbi:hypothetical protein Nepgr_008500 [Nepenthes gracilis]|uniref:Uncharacterized protein n=1 Tax=Nepenthes gracilis TaxID=150966 RepID=A0AAD3XJF7_NEPGR|nr:hypothetical protein Nepgr_008500 [Nepenthes gracilis]